MSVEKCCQPHSCLNPCFGYLFEYRLTEERSSLQAKVDDMTELLSARKALTDSLEEEKDNLLKQLTEVQAEHRELATQQAEHQKVRAQGTHVCILCIFHHRTLS